MSRIFFFLLALFSASSSAFTTLDPYMVDAEVRRVNNFVSVDGDSVKVNVMGKGYGANQPYFNKTVSIPRTKFLSWVRANLKNLIKINPWWIAFAAAMAAAGWAFDALLNQFTSISPDKKPHPNSPFASCFMGANIGGTDYQFPHSPITYSSCLAAAAAHKVKFKPLGSFVCQPSSSGICYLKGEYTFTFSNGSSTVLPTYLQMHKDPNNPPVFLENQPEPVSDTSMLDSIFSNFLSNPTAAAQAMTAPGGYPYDDLFKNSDLKYIPGISEADYPALDCYFRGVLQTSNPGGACYATETEYQRIKQMAEQLKAGATPGGQADAMNDKLKDPLTQTQFEESLNKLSGADVNKVTDDASKIYDTGFKQLNDSILANTLPGMPDLIPLPQFQTGSCRSITLQFSFAGKNVTKQFPGDLGCVQLEKMKEFLGWLMAIAVTIGLMFAALREAN